MMIHQMMLLLHMEMQLRQQALVGYTQAQDPNVRLQRLDEVLALNEQLNEVGGILTTLLNTPLNRLSSAVRDRSSRDRGASTSSSSDEAQSSVSRSRNAALGLSTSRATAPPVSRDTDDSDAEDSDELSDSESDNPSPPSVAMRSQYQRRFGLDVRRPIQPTSATQSSATDSTHQRGTLSRSVTSEIPVLYTPNVQRSSIMEDDSSSNRDVQEGSTEVSAVGTSRLQERVLLSRSRTPTHRLNRSLEQPSVRSSVQRLRTSSIQEEIGHGGERAETSSLPRIADSSLSTTRDRSLTSDEPLGSVDSQTLDESELSSQVSHVPQQQAGLPHGSATHQAALHNSRNTVRPSSRDRSGFVRGESIILPSETGNQPAASVPNIVSTTRESLHRPPRRTLPRQPPGAPALQISSNTQRLTGMSTEELRAAVTRPRGASVRRDISNAPISHNMRSSNESQDVTDVSHEALNEATRSQCSLTVTPRDRETAAQETAIGSTEPALAASGSTDQVVAPKAVARNSSRVNPRKAVRARRAQSLDKAAQLRGGSKAAVAHNTNWSQSRPENSRIPIPSSSNCPTRDLRRSYEPGILPPRRTSTCQQSTECGTSHESTSNRQVVNRRQQPNSRQTSNLVGASQQSRPRRRSEIALELRNLLNKDT